MTIRQAALDFSSLTEMDDGRINKLVVTHLKRIADDCMDRPGDEGNRSVEIKFTAKPVRDQEGRCESVTMEIECKSKIPVYRSKPYQMKPTKGGFLFNEDFPGELHQPPLPNTRD